MVACVTQSVAGWTAELSKLEVMLFRVGRLVSGGSCVIGFSPQVKLSQQNRHAYKSYLELGIFYSSIGTRAGIMRYARQNHVVCAPESCGTRAGIMRRCYAGLCPHTNKRVKNA